MDILLTPINKRSILVRTQFLPDKLTDTVYCNAEEIFTVKSKSTHIIISVVRYNGMLPNYF